MILASQSPRRRQLLEELGYDLTVIPADIDETTRPGEKPPELVCRLATSKAEASRSLAATRGAKDAEGLLVAADTIVWDDEGNVLGKPADAADASRMLHELAGKVHHVSTGCCALRLSPTCEPLASTAFVETTDVEFWDLTEDEIEEYVATKEPLDKAGAYGIQGLGRTLVRRIHGDYFTVVGLPVSRLVRELRSL